MLLLFRCAVVSEFAGTQLQAFKQRARCFWFRKMHPQLQARHVRVTGCCVKCCIRCCRFAQRALQSFLGVC